MKKSINAAIMVVMFIALLLVTLISFHSWANLSAATIELNEKALIEVNVDMTVPEGKNLVPKGVIMGVNDINEITLTYKVKLKGDISRDYNLNVYTDKLKVGNTKEFNHLVNFEYDFEQTIDEKETNVIITVSLNEPSNEKEYLGIVNKNITFSIVFQAN